MKTPRLRENRSATIPHRMSLNHGCINSFNHWTWDCLDLVVQLQCHAWLRLDLPAPSLESPSIYYALAEMNIISRNKGVKIKWIMDEIKREILDCIELHTPIIPGSWSRDDKNSKANLGYIERPYLNEEMWGGQWNCATPLGENVCRVPGWGPPSASAKIF